jgi:hypothetical protein
LIEARQGGCEIAPVIRAERRIFRRGGSLTGSLTAASGTFATAG